MNSMNEGAMADRLLDVHAIAERVGGPRTTPATVWRAHRLGQMPPAIKVLGRLRWRAKDIEAYVNGEWPVPAARRLEPVASDSETHLTSASNKKSVEAA